MTPLDTRLLIHPPERFAPITDAERQARRLARLHTAPMYRMWAALCACAGRSRSGARAVMPAE